ncbi:U3 small nucleolar RNA-associated protein 18 homolog [Saccoglossus kowalevskii]|uniref:U3 small nucleolar RNA-associated protein 18 homolog n=1 Tax=Saccoglossus kowalevskii TaxID=10224 RepID=A0ABM0GYZ3_SACKO|nr:PREDICTED: U3 small nucleolar RNA-associated protein 18 homolog [Saccoglossus kowalevskii]
MLRQRIKRSLDEQVENTERDDAKNRKTATRQQKFLTLGSDNKQEEEEMLEKLVFGGEHLIIEQFEKESSKSKTTKEDNSEERSQGILDKKIKPAWIDEDDEQVVIDFTQRKHQYLKKPNDSVLTGDILQERLRSNFEKAVGRAPSWAKLKSEREEDSEGASDDEDDVLKHTGDYLTTSDKLTKDILQIKRCTHANKQKPTQGKIESVEFHPGAQVILTAGRDQTLNLFQVDGRTNPKIQSVFVEDFPIRTAHFTADGEQVVMSANMRCFYVYDMMAGKVIRIPDIKGIQERNLTTFKISPDGKYIVFLGSYGYMYVLSAKNKEWITTLKMNGSVDAIAFNDDGSRMYSHGDDGEVYIWDMNSRRCVHRFIDEGCIKGTSLAVANHEQYVACGSDSGVVNIYDDSCLTLKSPKPIKSAMNLVTRVTQSKFNSTNEILAVSSNLTKDAVKLIHFPSMSAFSNFPEFQVSIYKPTCLDFSPRSGYLAIGNNKGDALLYRLKHYSES